MTFDAAPTAAALPADARSDRPAGVRADAPVDGLAESPAGGSVPAASGRRPWQQLLRFAGVGVTSTAAYALLYLLLRPMLGAFAANALALLLTAVANTAANRRLTFGVRGSSGVFGDHAVGLLAFGAGLLLTSGALAGLHAVTDPGRWLELLVLMTANALATLLRFVVLRFRIGGAPARA